MKRFTVCAIFSNSKKVMKAKSHLKKLGINGKDMNELVSPSSAEGMSFRQGHLGHRCANYLAGAGLLVGAVFGLMSLNYIGISLNGRVFDNKVLSVIIYGVLMGLVLHPVGYAVGRRFKRPVLELGEQGGKDQFVLSVNVSAEKVELIEETLKAFDSASVAKTDNKQAAELGLKSAHI